MSTQHQHIPRLRVVAGPSSGTVFVVPDGSSTIGRDPACGLHLADDQVNGRHAVLKRDGSRVTLTDLGSRNGTSVNGRPVHGTRELRPGDVIHLAAVPLVFELGPDRRPAAQGPAPAAGSQAGNQVPVGRVRMLRVILLASAVALLGWLATSVFTFVADQAVGVPAWLLAPGAAVAAGIVQAIFEALTGDRAASDASRAPWSPPRRRGVPVVVAIAVVLVMGVAAYGATVGIRYGVGWLTGNEDPVGRERLVSSPAPSAASGRVSVTVTSVVNTRHFTRVALVVSNQEKESATLSLFRNCVLTGGDVTLQAEPFKSGWPEDVPPGSTQRGSVTFPGHLPDGPVTAQFSFLRVFVFGRFGVDDSVVVRQIKLRAP